MHFFLLSLLSAVLLIFSFPEADLEILAWFGLVPLFFLIQEVRTQKQLLAFTFLTGFLFYSGLMYWFLFLASWSVQDWAMGVAVYLGYFALMAVLAIFFWFFAWPCWKLRQTRGISFIWTAPVIWTAIEYIKTHLFSGYPWGLLGVSQYKALPFIQISEWTGVYGVSFLVVMGNAWLFEVIYAVMGKRKPLPFLEAASPLIVITLIFFYGISFFYVPQSAKSMVERETGIVLREDSPKEDELSLADKAISSSEQQVKISLIQGNIPQDVKWSKQYEKTIHKVYKEMTLAEVKREKPDLVIWPETAIPAYLRFDKPSLKLVSGLVRETKTPFLIGASDAQQKLENQNGEMVQVVRYFNSAFLAVPGKGFTQQYDKIHLVPYGEYVPIPFLKKLTPLQDSYTKGEIYKVFDFSLPFSVVICYEDIFPNLVRQFVKNGAQWLVNMTNDGWFKNSSAPMQHAAHSIFRAVENRVWLVRATNTGVSCFVDPYGRIQSQIQDDSGRNVWISGTLTHSIGKGLGPTFYTRFGDVFSWLMLALTGMLLILIRRNPQGGK